MFPVVYIVTTTSMQMTASCSNQSEPKRSAFDVLSARDVDVAANNVPRKVGTPCRRVIKDDFELRDNHSATGGQENMTGNDGKEGQTQRR